MHLIRDPRGIVNSRKQIDKVFKVNNAINVCKRLLKNGRLGSDGPEWLKKRYLRVRYA